ncbi:unnamed protein product [Lupinus luteus]|uniref:Uncharacterized protein n=1 Tax=Lupinus luteus TaxID=3873 RepID=A0AAV1WBQ4_LUPLU
MDSVMYAVTGRNKVHRDATHFCQAILQKKSFEWKALMHKDLVITVDGDGTLLQASHFLDDKVSVLGVNSDPTQINEVEHFSSELDATRSTHQLCDETVESFKEFARTRKKI